MARITRKKNPLQPEAEPSPAVQKIYRTAAYVRLSLADSGKPGADTIEGQKALLTAFIQSKPDLQLCALFCDNGKSGTNFERPQFEQMLQQVKKGQIDCIVVKDLSRFGLNYKESGNYLERIFPFLGIRFIAVNDGFDTLNAEGVQEGLLVPLKNLINEVYSKDISKKAASAFYAKQKNGEFLGSWAPYGYRKDPNNRHHLCINEETAPTVRQIFQWRAEGMGLMRIAQRLNAACVPSPSAYLYESGRVKTEKYRDVPWHMQALKKILSHPVYLGHMVQGRKRQSFCKGMPQIEVPEADWIIVRNTHEPIVEEETFAAVQQLAKQKRSEYYERLGKYAFLGQTEHMLPGLLYCAHCGKPLKRHKKVSHGKRQWYHYICPTHAADASRCQSVNIREEEVQKVLFTTIRTQIDVAADLEALTKKLAAQPQCSERRSAHAARLEAVRRRRKRSQALQDSLYQNYVEQLMSEQEYRMLKARYKAEIAEAERQLAALEQEVCAEQAYTVENRFLTAFCAFTDADALTKEMAAALVARVDVDTKKQVVIHLRYRDEYAALLQWLKGGHSDAGCDVSSPVR